LNKKINLKVIRSKLLMIIRI